MEVRWVRRAVRVRSLHPCALPSSLSLKQTVMIAGACPQAYWWWMHVIVTYFLSALFSTWYETSKHQTKHQNITTQQRWEHRSTEEDKQHTQLSQHSNGIRNTHTRIYVVYTKYWYLLKVRTYKKWVLCARWWKGRAINAHTCSTYVPGIILYAHTPVLLQGTYWYPTKYVHRCTWSDVLASSRIRVLYNTLSTGTDYIVDRYMLHATDSQYNSCSPAAREK